MPRHPVYFSVWFLQTRTLSCIATSQPPKPGNQHCYTTCPLLRSHWRYTNCPNSASPATGSSLEPSYNQLVVSFLCPSVWNCFSVFCLPCPWHFWIFQGWLHCRNCLSWGCLCFPQSQAMHLWQEGRPRGEGVLSLHSLRGHWAWLVPLLTMFNLISCIRRHSPGLSIVRSSPTK